MLKKAISQPRGFGFNIIALYIEQMSKIVDDESLRIKCQNIRERKLYGKTRRGTM